MPEERRAWGRTWEGSLVAALLVAPSCAGEPDELIDPVQAEPEWPLPRSCEAPPGLGSPSTIEEVVELVNALPKPTRLPCVIESLERPFEIYASTSTAGAQPADGPHNPRIFLFRGDLVMSVVAEGESSATLELAQGIGGRMSIKAELAFPIDEVLEASAPYDQVEVVGGTSCGLCHGNEARVTSIDFANAWASDVYQDEPEQALSLSFLRQSAIDCDHEAEPQRCEMLDALFAHGELEPGDLARDSIICRPF